MRNDLRSPSRDQRGMSLIELMIALVVLSVGILAVGGLFPAASRSQQQAKMTNSANYYAQEKIEELSGMNWIDPALTDGRHPATGYESLGSGGQWQRSYEVATMAEPLNHLKRVTVTVEWRYLASRSVISTTYVRR